MMQAANEIKKDAEEQLARIRRGESALACKLPADGHSIVEVLFGSEQIGHLIAAPPRLWPQSRDSIWTL